MISKARNQVNFNGSYIHPLLKDLKHALISDTDSRTNFFTKKMERISPLLDVSQLNEKAYDELGEKYGIYEGINVKDIKHLDATQIDDIYFHVADLEDTELKDTRFVTFYKVNPYNGKMSYLRFMASVDMESIKEIFEDENIEAEAAKADKSEYEYVNDKVENVADLHTKFLFEGLIGDTNKDTVIKNLFQNTQDSAVVALKLGKTAKSITNFKDFMRAVRESVLRDFEFGYLHELYKRNHIDPTYLIDEFKQMLDMEDKTMSKNNLSLSCNNKGEFVVSGTYVGTIGEVTKTLEDLKERAYNMVFKPQRSIITEFSNDMTDACLFSVTCKAFTNEPIQTYEVGIELPMDFGKLRGVDEAKVCDLLDINGMPIYVDHSAKECGSLNGKPVLFVMESKVHNPDEAIAWARECAEKVANYDFATYYLEHGGYNDLLRPIGDIGEAALDIPEPEPENEVLPALFTDDEEEFENE